MPRVLIIADDLTGAADCGAPFAGRGIASTVLLATRGEGAVSAADFADADVLAIDADTRSLGPVEAAASVARIVDAHRDAAVVMFKKIDSTLRGNVAVELVATLAARRAYSATRSAILFAPAFPACGRTTVNGRQWVFGTPVEHSAFWRGERVRPGNGIAAMLEEAGLTCAGLELARVRAGVSALADAMRKAASGADVVICDAETEADLEAIALAGMLFDTRTVWAGSAGLARHLADVPAFVRTTGTAARHSRPPRVQGPSLFVVGSPAEVSRAQAQALAGQPDISVFTLPASDVLNEQTEIKAREHAKFVSERLQNGYDVLVRLDSGEEYAPEQGRLLARALAAMIAPCANHVAALFATGGETARAILDAWGIRHFQLLGEVEPGLPYAITQCAGRDVLILTKAGGFGTPDTLIRCREFLRSLSHDAMQSTHL